MSCIALSPFREIAIDAFEVRNHRSLFALNLLPKRTRAQALRSRANQLPLKALAPTNARAIALVVTASM